MLQQFTVENFLSFKDRQVLKLSSSRGTKKKEHRIEPIKGSLILKTAAFFGPNAVGKSNFIEALALAKRLVIAGTPTESPIEHHPFRLSDESKHSDTVFTFLIITNGKKYEYGFSYNAEQITCEWLYIITRRTKYTVFRRNTSSSEYDLSYLRRLNPNEEEGQFLTFFARATPPRQLFLHEVISRNLSDNVSKIEDLLAIKDWFIYSLKVLFPDTPYKQGGMLKAVSDENLKEGFGELLRYFDTGIDGVDLKDVDFDKLDIPQDLYQQIKADLSKQNKTEAFGSLRLGKDLFLITYTDGLIRAKKLTTQHKHLDDDTIEQFSLVDESDGTKRIFDYIPLILDLIQGEKVFFIDEMERSLHPKLMLKLMELFFKYSENIPTQLIFTTHESTLMDQNLLRRDEIWLMEKTKQGVSSFERLDEKFSVRFDKELERNYLEGMFGSIPQFGPEKAIRQLRNILNI